MNTDTSEKGLEELIVRAMTGRTEVLSPFASYSLRPGDGVDSVAVKFVDEGFPGLTLFPGRTLPDRSDALNSLVVVWICAKEKARRNKPIIQPVRVTMHWKPVEKIADTFDYVLDKTTIHVADRDEVIHCIGGVDLRNKLGLLLKHSP